MIPLLAAALLSGCGGAPDASAPQGAPSDQAREVEARPYGKLTWHRFPPQDGAPVGAPPVILHLSDATGEPLARGLPGSLVVDVPVRRVLKKAMTASPCYDLAQDLEQLAASAQQGVGLTQWVRPILAGSGTGGALAWAAMAQADDLAFSGLVASDFCPRLPVSRLFCGRQDWRTDLDAAGIQHLPPRRELALLDSGRPRLAVSFATDCASIAAFQKGSADMEEVSPGNILLALQERYPTAPAAPPTPQGPAALSALDLPLTVTWPSNPVIATLFLSGAGGPGTLEAELGRNLSQEEVAWMVLDSSSWLWSRRTPEDLAALVGKVQAALPPGIPLFLGGLGFGAEVAAVARAPLGPSIAGLVLVGPGQVAALQVGAPERFPDKDETPAHSVEPLLSAEGGPVLCVRALEDPASGCPSSGVTLEALKGSRRFDGTTREVAQALLGFMERVALSP